jgi:hypothetical protein
MECLSGSAGSDAIPMEKRYLTYRVVSRQPLVFLFRHRLKPLVGAPFRRHFHCDMSEPAVLRGSMPMSGFRRDIDHVAGVEFPGRLSPLLVPATSAGDEKDLSALVVDMPELAATRLKGLPSGYSVLSEAMSMEKRYFTSDLTSRS